MNTTEVIEKLVRVEIGRERVTTWIGPMQVVFHLETIVAFTYNSVSVSLDSRRKMTRKVQEDAGYADAPLFPKAEFDRFLVINLYAAMKEFGGQLDALKLEVEKWPFVVSTTKTGRLPSRPEPRRQKTMAELMMDEPPRTTIGSWKPLEPSPERAAELAQEAEAFVAKAATMGLLHPDIARLMVEGKDADAIWEALLPKNPTLTYRRVLDIVADLKENS